MHLRRAGQARVCEAKIENFHSPATVAAWRDHDVFRLEIAMHDSVPVRRRQRIGKLNRGVDELGRTEPATAQLAPQRPPINELINDERGLQTCDEIEHGCDPRITQPRRTARFQRESAPQANVLASMRQQHFDRNRTSELSINSAQHDAHSTASDLFLHAVSRCDEIARLEAL